MALAAMYVGVPYAPSRTRLFPSGAGVHRTPAGLRANAARSGVRGRWRAIRTRAQRGAASGRRACHHAICPIRHSFDAIRVAGVPLVTPDVDAARDRVGPDTIAKVLFTSGSTGRPKGVINTQRMLCSNQEMLRSVLAFLGDAPPVLCDWLPWNHTAGGNHNFGLVLYNGGTLYIDEGKPAPALFAATLRNLLRSPARRTSRCPASTRC